MTQEPGEGTRGAWDGAVMEYGGWRARFLRDGESFVVETTRPGADAPERAVVARTVGSRRMQQLFRREGDEWVRLPWAWHIEESRWMPMIEAFLTADPSGLEDGLEAGSIARVDYERHVTRWNDNCVFCHNVAPRPGLAEDGSFDTTVAELGIACEACHGPGEEHARLNASPLRRTWLRLSEGGDPTIVHPSRLSPERSADVCGRCHGQRITDDVGAFLAHGDPFVPGDDLALYSAPLWHDTEQNGEAGVFAARFWRDGTARLTAYEYQGLLASACAVGGRLTCTDCHGMHEGDPRGQVRPSMEGDAMCVGCHAEQRGAGHTRHDGESVACVDCHMPRVVYGIRAVHRSHRIDIPRPASGGRPDACTLCHVDRSLAWAAEASERLWGREAGESAARDQSVSAVVGLALGGDPIERAVAAAALGRGDVEGGDGMRAGVLLSVMREDRYPAVRAIAWRALRGLWPEIADQRAYVPWGPRGEREAAVDEIERRLIAAGVGVEAPAAELRARLASWASEVAIEIGE